jgi:hypothetical protein
MSAAQTRIALAASAAGDLAASDKPERNHIEAEYDSGLIYVRGVDEESRDVRALLGCRPCSIAGGDSFLIHELIRRVNAYDGLAKRCAVLEKNLKAIYGLRPLDTADRNDLWLAIGEIRVIALRSIGPELEADGRRPQIEQQQQARDWDDDEPPIDGVGFADPGGRSALRAATRGNPRNLPCPNCGTPNVLTRIDRLRGYQCDRCADRAESGMDY